MKHGLDWGILIAGLPLLALCGVLLYFIWLTITKGPPRMRK